VHAERPRRARQWLLGGVAALLGLGFLYVVTLLLPQLFFSWARDGASILVRSDAPIPDSAAAVIAGAEARIRQSPLFDPTRRYPVYVCNSRWRWNYFSGFNDQSRAFATAMGRVVFTRPARWGPNRLVGPDGSDGPRSLDVYIAHEVTHLMVLEHLGVMANRRLPAWLREGYAEYVARRDTFDYDSSRKRLIAGDEAFMTRRSDPYLKYVLLIAHLLEREGLDVSTLLNHPPDADEVEARVRAGMSSP